MPTRILGAVTAGILVSTASGAVAASAHPSEAPVMLKSPGVHAASAPLRRLVPQGNVIANLWEWNWPSVARECSTVLGPKGFGGVQVAPPQDSLSRTSDQPEGVLHP